MYENNESFYVPNSSESLSGKGDYSMISMLSENG